MINCALFCFFVSHLVSLGTFASESISQPMPVRLFGAREDVLDSFVGLRAGPLKTALPVQQRKLLDAYSPSPSPSGLCGNGVLDVGEECDPKMSGAQYCGPDCKCQSPAVAISRGVCYSTCGDGVYESTLEECDYLLDKVFCSLTCHCQYGSVSAGNGKCETSSTCGNGIFDSSKECEASFTDTSGNSYCNPTTCKCDANTTPDHAGRCVPNCGNGVLNSGEECDYALGKTWCSYACKCRGASTPAGNGTCTPPANPCGPQQNCNPAVDPTYCVAVAGCKCKIGTAPSKTVSGACTRFCGDGVYEPGLEECEYTLDKVFCNKGDCRCVAGSIPDGTGKCTPTGSCGDGTFVAANEQCDPKLDTSGACTYLCRCRAGSMPVGDGSCTVTCGDHKFEPSEEECDHAIDPFRCGINCKCLRGVPNGAGDCYCGNGQVECNNALCDHCLPTCKCRPHFKPLVLANGSYSGYCIGM